MRTRIAAVIVGAVVVSALAWRFYPSAPNENESTPGGGGSTASAPDRSATTSLTLDIRGGLVIVTSEKDELLHFGPLRDSTPKHSLTIKPGDDTRAQSTTLQPTADGEYVLDGLVLRLAGGGLPAAGLPGLPDVTVSETLPGPESWNNQFLVPDLAAIAKAVTGRDHGLTPGWRELLNGRIMLAGGTITVRLPAGEPEVQDALWTFAVPGGEGETKPVRQQAVSNELQYTVSLSEPAVVFVDASGREVLRLMSRGDAHAISATIESRVPETHSMTLEPGDPLPHFGQLYDVLAPVVPAAQRAVPHYRPQSEAFNRYFEPYCTGIWMKEPEGL